MPEPDEKPIGYGALIRRNKNFRWLWLGQVVSMLGDWFNMIGAAALMGKLIGLAIAAPLLSLPMVLLGELVRSMGGATVWVFSTQLLLQTAPNEIRGRVFGTELACYMLMGGIGTIIVGALLDVFPNTHLVLWGMSGVPLIPALLWWLWLAARRNAGKR